MQMTQVHKNIIFQLISDEFCYKVSIQEVIIKLLNAI